MSRFDIVMITILFLLTQMLVCVNGYSTGEKLEGLHNHIHELEKKIENILLPKEDNGVSHLPPKEPQPLKVEDVE